MTKPLAELQLLLLDLLSPIREVSQKTIDQLEESEWAKIMAMAKDHRVTPLLDWRFKNEKSFLSIPDNIRTACADDFKASILRALSIQRELLVVHRLLNEGEFPHIFLKGAYLAYFAYPRPGMRAMRDLDILLPEHKVISAFDFLVEHGLERIAGYRGVPHPSNINLTNHLPPIYSPSKTLCLELHTSLFHVDERPQAHFDPSKDPSFWERSVQRSMSGENLDFASPADLLLHLIEHAVYDHQFNNGPLTLSDISYLLNTHEIDWPMFWRITEKSGCIKGVRLTLELVQRYYGKSNIEWTSGPILDEPISERVLTASSLLLLREMKMRENIGLISIVKTRTDASSTFAFIKKRLFPSRAQLGVIYPISPTSPMIYFYYPKNWWRMLTERVPDFLLTTRKGHFAHEVRLLSTVNDWLYS